MMWTLLLAVVCSRVSAGIPQSIAHDHAHNDNHAVEMSGCGDDLSIGNHSDHHELVYLSPHESDDGNLDADQDQHHHHLHLCSLGGSALTGQSELHLTLAKPELRDTQEPTLVIRRHERLLRPPQV